MKTYCIYIKGKLGKRKKARKSMGINTDNEKGKKRKT